MTKTKILGVVCISAFLAGCAQQEEPARAVYPEPTFNKMGVATCPSGYKYDQTHGCYPDHLPYHPNHDDEGAEADAVRS